MKKETDFVIETNNLSKSFWNVRALKDVCLQSPRGSIFSFLFSIALSVPFLVAVVQHFERAEF